jgi:hypothetical protein
LIAVKYFQLGDWFHTGLAQLCNVLFPACPLRERRRRFRIARFQFSEVIMWSVPMKPRLDKSAIKSPATDDAASPHFSSGRHNPKQNVT